MSSLATPTISENLALNINTEIRVKAKLETTFEALLEQLSSGLAKPEGEPMPMKLEAWPGGRWYRDLGDGNGHFWGTVQAIRKPTLLEICGPLFMSYAVANNLQYRLSEVDGGTLIVFHHYALGVLPDDMRQNINKGWSHINESVKKHAEGKR